MHFFVSKYQSIYIPNYLIIKTRIPVKDAGFLMFRFEELTFI